MTDIKRLYEVLPPDKRMLETLKIADCLHKPMVLQSAEKLSAGDTQYRKLTISFPPSGALYTLTVNAEQIVSVIDFLRAASLFPVLVKLVPSGKSYAMVDPVEYGTNPSATIQPTLIPDDKDNPK